MKRLIIMAYLMQKRLLKKPVFIVILLIVPLAAASISAISKKETGILNIAIYKGNQTDKTAKAVISRIKNHKNIINAVFYQDPKAAENSVISGNSDCAWIFSENFEKAIYDYCNGKNADKKLVQIILKEETIPTKLSGELLFGTVFPEITKEIYLHCVAKELKLAEKISKSEMMSIYSEMYNEKSVIEFIDEKGNNTEKSDFLVSPMRGILAIFIMVTALASAMYFIGDLAAGVFATMPLKRRLYLLFCSVFFGALDCGIIAIISIAFTPLFTDFFTEISTMAIYIMTVSAFSAFFAALINNAQKIGVFICFISLSVFAFCPVFFNFHVPLASDILPQSYYLKLSGGNNFISQAALFAGYFIACAAVFYISERNKSAQ